ncbi:hypothetical protein B0H16DRAFT_1738463 [Mycena metata]|uniref:Uncharacterized protein n=1 Tax=Mycena metata TaxID=1033252 RepID=A0AAD7HJ36_9AGAR|nr:hypothetical protein B0H16DRAFT_1738463 [Mycena metata]
MLYILSRRPFLHLTSTLALFRLPYLVFHVAHSQNLSPRLLPPCPPLQICDYLASYIFLVNLPAFFILGLSSGLVRPSSVHLNLPPAYPPPLRAPFPSCQLPLFMFPIPSTPPPSIPSLPRHSNPFPLLRRYAPPPSRSSTPTPASDFIFAVQPPHILPFARRLHQSYLGNGTGDTSTLFEGRGITGTVAPRVAVFTVFAKPATVPAPEAPVPVIPRLLPNPCLTLVVPPSTPAALTSAYSCQALAIPFIGFRLPLTPLTSGSNSQRHPSRLRLDFPHYHRRTCAAPKLDVRWVEASFPPPPLLDFCTWMLASTEPTPSSLPFLLGLHSRREPRDLPPRSGPPRTSRFPARARAVGRVVDKVDTSESTNDEPLDTEERGVHYYYYYYYVPSFLASITSPRPRVRTKSTPGNLSRIPWFPAHAWLDANGDSESTVSTRGALRSSSNTCSISHAAFLCARFLASSVHICALFIVTAP